LLSLTRMRPRSEVMSINDAAFAAAQS
jgi:hypothetical protein